MVLVLVLEELETNGRNDDAVAAKELDDLIHVRHQLISSFGGRVICDVCGELLEDDGTTVASLDGVGWKVEGEVVVPFCD